MQKQSASASRWLLLEARDNNLPAKKRRTRMLGSQLQRPHFTGWAPQNLTKTATWTKLCDTQGGTYLPL